MNGPLVFDASVFVHLIRGRGDDRVVIGPVTAGQGYLCAVVAHELWAGTQSREDADALALLVRGFERLGAVLIPSYDDWVLSGRLLQRYQRLYGAIAPKDNAHDLLIVMCAAQVHGTVVTANLRRLDRWARMARRAGRQVRVRSMRPN